MAGIRKARVLPEPVRAAPSKSFPARSTGIDFACTFVIVVKPISSRACMVGGDRSREENGVRSDTSGAVEVEASGSAAMIG